MLGFPADLHYREPIHKGEMAGIRRVIAEYTNKAADNAAAALAKSGRLAAVGEAPAEEEEIEEGWEGVELSPETDQKVREADRTGALGLLALVKEDFLKNKKGGKKGRKGDCKCGKGKACYECGAEGHIGADCPIRAQRVAAGGPETDNPMKWAKGSSKKGGNKGDKESGKGGKVGV